MELQVYLNESLLSLKIGVLQNLIVQNLEPCKTSHGINCITYQPYMESKHFYGS